MIGFSASCLVENSQLSPREDGGGGCSVWPAAGNIWDPIEKSTGAASIGCPVCRLWQMCGSDQRVSQQTQSEVVQPGILAGPRARDVQNADALALDEAPGCLGGLFDGFAAEVEV